MARYKKRMMGGSGRLASTLSSTKRRARKLYDENKKKTWFFTLALLAGVGAYFAGFIKFQNPKQN